MSWKQTRDFDGVLLTEEFQREDGTFRVGSNKMTREGARPYYVQAARGGVFSRDARFPRRFASAGAAMQAVDKRVK